MLHHLKKKPLSHLEKILNDTNICLFQEQSDKQTSIHFKIDFFTHKYQIQRRVRQSLVYVGKAFDHATFSTLKNNNTGTQLSPAET